jgi:hypothetical protein
MNVRLSQPVVSDRDPLLSLAADCARLAVEDYLAGPGTGREKHATQRRRDDESARLFLERVGLLEHVRERLGAPEEAGGA